MRNVLVSILSDSKTTKENQGLALRILYRVGAATQSVETLASAAYFTLKLGIDVSKGLESWLKRPEVYSFESNEDIGDLDLSILVRKTLQKSVDFGDDAYTQISTYLDAWAIHDGHIYNYNEMRGLTKFKKDADGKMGSL